MYKTMTISRDGLSLEMPWILSMSIVPMAKCTSVFIVCPKSVNSWPVTSAASRVMLPIAKEKMSRTQLTTPMQSTTCFRACEQRTLNSQSSIEMLAMSATMMAYKKMPRTAKISYARLIPSVQVLQV
eukprot:Skav211940  [mRNA]  locus=scaffold1086:630335:633816:+ [translate_table: standard]